MTSSHPLDATFAALSSATRRAMLARLAEKFTIHKLADGGYPAAIDNQFRYLSAIYLLVTMLLWWTIPKVETHGMVLALVCAAIFIGGLARFLSYTSVGPGSDEQFAGMIIELCVPVFLIWQRLVARKATAA